MMPTKEEIINRIAIALYNSGENDGWIWETETEENKQNARDLAETALQALLESLSKPVDGYQNKHDMYYRQLIGMKK